MENKIKDIKYDWNDFCLIPEPISKINSRRDIKSYHLGERLIIVSPMDTVINKNNWQDFAFDGDMEICMPRGQKVDVNYVYNSISLEDFELLTAKLESGIETINQSRILVDIANGNLQRLYNTTKRFLSLNTKVELMVGNIANPETFRLYAELGVYACRLGVGGGSACTTFANTGVHYPMASLISECYIIKKENDYKTKLVADGGFKNYDEIIKAIACGADQVMLGSVLNKSLESCGDTFLFGIKINKYKQFIWNRFPNLRKYMTKSYRGMSTKEVQRSWNKKELRTAEGISKTNKVEYSIKQWSDNFSDYLRSAMSYCNAQTISEFRDCQKVFITQQAFKRFHK